MIFVLAVPTLGYLWAWRRRQSPSPQAGGFWRPVSFLLGVSLVWLALDSPLTAYDHHLLTVHMIQHLLLMTVAPPLILLGEPLARFWHVLPRSWRLVLGRALQWAPARRRAAWVVNPAFCWVASTLTLVAWHVPALLTMALQSEVWHAVEQSSFLGAGLLFWLPVVRPWPTPPTGPQWSMLLYLFLATLPCDALAGFLVFSDRVVYPAYLAMPRHFGFSVLEDQQCAAALMWTGVTLAYLVPAAILSTRLVNQRATDVYAPVSSNRSRSGADIA